MYRIVIFFALACSGLGCGGSTLETIRLDGDKNVLFKTYRSDARARPNDAMAQARLGAIQLKLGRNADAARTLSRAAALSPKNAEIARWQGQALLALEQPLSAQAAFERATKLDVAWAPTYVTDVQPLLLSAFATYARKPGAQLQSVAPGLKRLSKAVIDSNPKAISDIYSALGRHWFAQGANNEAIEAFQTALSTGKAPASVQFNLGRCHAVLGNLDQAKGFFEAYVKDNNTSERVIEVGDALENLFRFDAAAEFYRRALADKASDNTLRLKLATVLLKAKKYTDAKAILSKILHGSKAPKEHVSVAKLYLKFRRIDEAIGVWKRVIELAPSDIGQWKVLARVLRDNGKLGELEKTIGHSDMHAHWGEVYADISQWDKAAQRFKKAIKNGGKPELWLHLGRTQHRLNLKAARNKSYTRYIKSAPDRVKALSLVAAAYERDGEPQLALKLLRQSVKLSGLDSKPVFAIARLLRGQNNTKGEQAVLSDWAKRHKTAAERAVAFKKIAERYEKLGQPKQAYESVQKGLSEGKTPVFRELLLLAADLSQKRLKHYGSAEEHYLRWIDATPQAKRFEARQLVALRVKGLRQMRRFRNRLLEDMVRDRPKDARTYRALAESYLAGRPRQSDEALHAFERYIELSGSSTKSILVSGDALHRAGSRHQAAEIYRKLNPDQISKPELHVSLTRLFLRVNDKSRAREHINRFLNIQQKLMNGTASRLFRLAKELSQRGLYDSAVSVYRRILPVYKNRATVLSAMAEAMLGNGDVGGADAMFRSFISARNGKHSAIRVVAEVFYNKGQYKRAREYYERLFSDGRGRSAMRVFPRLADVYLKLGDSDALLSSANKYVNVKPKPRAYAKCAQYLRRAGLKDEALSFLGKAAELQPRTYTYRRRQAILALEMGQLDRAQKLLMKFIRVQKGRSNAWLNAGELLSSRGFDKPAIALYDSAIKEGVAASEVYLARGRVNLRLGNSDKAHADFIEALNKTESPDKVLNRISAAYKNAGKLEKYVDILHRVIALFPSRRDTLYELGDVALTLGRVNEARQSFDRFIQRNEKGAIRVAARLWAYGDLAAARTLYERALTSSVSVGRSGAFDALITVLSALGTPEKVGEAVQRFLASGKNVNQQLLELTGLLIKKGYVAEAIRYYERLLSRTKVPGGHQKLGRLYLMSGHFDKAQDAFARYIKNNKNRVRRRSRTPAPSPAAQRVLRILEVATDYVAMGKDKAALQLISQARRENPTFARLHVFQARILLSTGDVIGATSALEGLVHNRTIDRLTGEELHLIHHLLIVLGREREAYDVLSRVPPAQRSLALSMELVRLPLHLGDAAAGTEIVDGLLARDNRGTIRVDAGNAFLSAQLFDEAAQHFQDALKPGRGKSSVEFAARGLLVVGRLAGNADAPSEVERLVGRVYQDLAQFHRTMARVMYTTGYFSRAEKHARQWLKVHPERPSGLDLFRASQPNPWRVLVLTLLRKGDKKAAWESVENYITVAENPLRAQKSMAELLGSHMAYDLSLKLYERAASGDKADRKSRLESGKLSLEMGLLRQAQAHFDDYLSSGDNRSESWRKIAMSYGEAGYWVQADKAHAKADESGKSELISRVRLVLKQGALKRANELIDREIQSAVSPLLAAVELCGIYVQGREMPVQVAFKLAERAIALRPTSPHPVALLVRAAALAEMGRDAEAKSDLAKTVKRGGADIGALLNRRAIGPHAARLEGYRVFARKALIGGRIELGVWALDQAMANTNFERGLGRAISVIRTALEDREQKWTPNERNRLKKVGMRYLEQLRLRLSPRDRPWFVTVQSDFLEHSGDLAGAIRSYEDAIAKFPAMASYRNNLAYLFSRHGKQLPRALKLVQSAQALQPEENLYYLDTEGWILFKMGRYKEALSKLNAAVRHMTERSTSAVSESLFHLGLCHLKLENVESARQTFRRAWRLDPNGTYGKRAAQELEKL